MADSVNGRFSKNLIGNFLSSLLHFMAESSRLTGQQILIIIIIIVFKEGKRAEIIINTERKKERKKERGK